MKLVILKKGIILNVRPINHAMFLSIVVEEAEYEVFLFDQWWC